MSGGRGVWVIYGVVAVVVAAAGLAAAYAVRAVLSPRTAFDDYVAELRAKGEPTTVRELLGPDSPADENAAPVITASFERAKARFGDVRGWELPGPWNQDSDRNWHDDASPEQMDRLRRAFDGLAPFFDEVRDAIALPRCRFAPAATPADSSSGTRVLQGVQRFLSARAEVGAPADRLDCCRTLLQLGDRNEPVSMIDAMVNAAIAGSGVHALRRGVEEGVIDPIEARKALDPTLARPWLPRAATALRLERIETLELIDAMYAGRVSTELSPIGDALNALLHPNMVRDGCEALRTLERTPVAPYSVFRRRTVETYEAAASKRSLILLAAPKIVESSARLETAARLARVALAVAEHRATHADFPASLDDMKPMFLDGVPLDPFTDAPFVYARTATGARIASLGRLNEAEPLDDATLRERCLVWELKR